MAVKRIRQYDPDAMDFEERDYAHTWAIVRRDNGIFRYSPYEELLEREGLEDDPDRPYAWHTGIECPNCWSLMGIAAGQSTSWKNAERERRKVFQRYLRYGIYHKTNLDCPFCEYRTAGGNKDEYPPKERL